MSDRVRLVRLSCIVCWVCLVPAAVLAQGSNADYERALSYDRRTRDKVFRNEVNPRWLDDGSQFWYRVETAPGEYEFVFVDAEAGSRSPAFDHERLAAALTSARGEVVSPKKLPLRAIEFADDVSTVRFRAFEKQWIFNRTSFELKEAEQDEASESTDRAVRRLEFVRPSRSTGDETEIRFVNRTEGEIELFWIEPSGERRSYGTIAAGEEHVQHTYEGHVWLAVDSDGRPLTAFQATAQPGEAVIDDSQRPRERRRRGSRRNRPRGAQSPDGRWRATIEDSNVVLHGQNAEESFALSTTGTENDPFLPRFYWSPDSKKLVAIQEEQGEDRKIHLIESSPDDQLQPKLHTVEYAKPGDKMPRARPRLFDLQSRVQLEVREDLFPNPWSISEIRWSPDSQSFTFLYNQRGHQVLRIVEVDAASGETRAVIDEESPTFIDYAHKEFTHYVEETSEIIWMSERDGWNHLYLYDAESGEVVNQITHGQWVVRGVERVDDQQRQIWFRAGGIRPKQDPYYVHLCRVNFDGSGLTVLTAGNGMHRWTFSPDERFFVDTWSRVDQPPVTELRRSDDGSLVCELERADWSRLLETGWQPPERFVAKGRDGVTDIYGIVVRPTDFDPHRKYPVIESIYAGPQGAFVPKSFGRLINHYSLAELGFIVVQIDGMGTSHRSKAFHDVCCKNLGDGGFPDRIAWLKAAAAEHPELDLSRVGIYGGSAGGQNALRGLLAHGDFYKVGAADCGCHDNRMDKIWWNELWMGYPVGPHYEEQSNVTQAHRLEGKLLLTVGELDRNVDPASTMQVVDALIKADKDFELVVFPGAGHGAGGSPYGRRRRMDFFVRHLLAVEPRWEDSEESAAGGSDHARTEATAGSPNADPTDETPSGSPGDLDPSATQMRSLIERYTADRRALGRSFGERLSQDRADRMRSFYKSWHQRLENLDFEGLDQAQRIDYLLLNHDIEHELRTLKLEAERQRQIKPLIPFADEILKLHSARRHVEDVKPAQVADKLVALGKQIGNIEQSIRDKKVAADAQTALRAADAVNDIRRTLERWHRFYDGYDPEFSWWVAKPYAQLEKRLEDYATFLREELGGVAPDDDDAIVGQPIGREALLSELEYEMIAYAPEELIEIAEKEFEWCRQEYKKAARELGFGDDWRKALEHVKTLHVQPGEQPRLIKQLNDEAIAFLEERDLLTIPELCKETWRMQMMSPERQRVNPYFTGGEVISVSFPTADMSHEDKLMSMRGNNIHFARATVHHELIPGHHLQGFMADRYRSHRQVFRTPFLVEGWALYWEMLLWDLGFPQTPEDRIGMLFWRSHRCARIIFSLKFHLGEMTADEAIDFLVENVGHERRNATAEVRRSVSGGYGPLYQAAYMLGGLQIRALHEQLVQDGRMTNREFHDRILQENSIPVAMIRASLTKESLARDYEPSWRFYDSGM